MIIPNKLSQFRDKKILLLVSGKQNMRIYETGGDTIKRSGEFRATLPLHTDNEGHFKVRSQGMVMKSGSVREVNNSEIISRFIKELKKQIKFLKASNYESVYLFCPSHTKKLIRDALPVTFQKKMHPVIEGNYYSETPIFLLGKLVDRKMKKKRLPLKSPEARKILKKSNRARKVIKGTPDYS